VNQPTLLLLPVLTCDRVVWADQIAMSELFTKDPTAEETSALMQVSRHTVLTFVRRIYGKLNVTSKAAAILPVAEGTKISRIRLQDLVAGGCRD
jgi:hypothetical protein